MPTRRPRRPTVALLVVLGLIAAACTPDATEDRDAREAAPPSPSPTPEPATVVMFAHGSDLYRYDVDADERELITGRGDNHAVSPDGTQVVYELELPTDATGPHLELIDIDDPFTIAVLGQGHEPLWSPDGRLVAAPFSDLGIPICDVDDGSPPRGTQVERAPLPAEVQDEDGCADTEAVRIYDASTADTTSAESDFALGSDIWRMIGWTEDERVLAQSRLEGHVAVGFRGAAAGDVEIAGPPGGQIRDVSPVEPVVLVRRRDGVFVAPLFDTDDEARPSPTPDDETPAPEATDDERQPTPDDTAATPAETDPTPAVPPGYTRLDLPAGTRVIASAFSPGGDHLALVVRTEADGPAHVVVADPATGEVSPAVTAYADPRGPMVWEQDGSRVAFAAGGPGDFRLVVCSLELHCTQAYEARRPIDLVWLGPDPQEGTTETTPDAPDAPSPTPEPSPT